MTTSFTNTPIAHTSDATFRAWGSELSGQLSSVGTASGCLTQTADTGQVNWTTVTRPGTNTAGGYEIWQLTDSLGVSAPVYIKLEFGTGGAAANPAMWVTVGTGTDGAGTITGSILARSTTGGGVLGSTVLSYPNYVCCTESFLGFALKVGVNGSGAQPFLLMVNRPCDADATIRSDGVVVYLTAGANLYSRSLNFASGITYGTSADRVPCQLPHNILNSLVGSNVQMFKHQCAYPAVHSINGLGSTLISEFNLGTSDIATLNGATPHMYMGLGGPTANNGVFSAVNASAINVGLCMLWE